MMLRQGDLLLLTQGKAWQDLVSPSLLSMCSFVHSGAQPDVTARTIASCVYLPKPLIANGLQSYFGSTGKVYHFGSGNA